MKTGLLLLGLLATALLTSCDAGLQSLEWYQTHDKELHAKVEECKKVASPVLRKTTVTLSMRPFVLAATLGPPNLKLGHSVTRKITQQMAKSTKPPRDSFLLPSPGIR